MVSDERPGKLTPEAIESNRVYRGPDRRDREYSERSLRIEKIIISTKDSTFCTFHRIEVRAETEGNFERRPVIRGMKLIGFEMNKK